MGCDRLCRGLSSDPRRNDNRLKRLRRKAKSFFQYSLCTAGTQDASQWTTFFYRNFISVPSKYPPHLFLYLAFHQRYVSEWSSS